MVLGRPFLYQVLIVTYCDSYVPKLKGCVVTSGTFLDAVSDVMTAMLAESWLGALAGSRASAEFLFAWRSS